MSTLQELAARLMEIGGKVPAGRMQEVHRLAVQAKEEMGSVIAEIKTTLGDSAITDRLEANSGELMSSLVETAAMAENSAAMAEGYRSFLQEAAAELVGK